MKINKKVKNYLTLIIQIILMCFCFLIIIFSIQNIAVGGKPLEIHNAKVLDLIYKKGEGRTPDNYYVVLEVDESLNEKGFIKLDIFGRDYMKMKINDEVVVTKWRVFNLYYKIRLGDTLNPNKVIHTRDYLNNK